MSELFLREHVHHVEALPTELPFHFVFEFFVVILDNLYPMLVVPFLVLCHYNLLLNFGQ
jgi:hypothetical protein